MDPVSAFAIATGAFGLATKCASMVKELYGIANKYEKAKLTLYSVIQEVNTIGAAWKRIGGWLEQASGDSCNDELLGQLEVSVEGGSLVISALLDDLTNYKNEQGKMSFGQRSKVFWNERLLRDHQERIRGHAIAMNLLLRVIEL